MQQYVYDPPMGSPPFEFLHNGGPISIQPPDQFWIRKTEPVKIGIKLDGLGNISREVWRDRTIWIVDKDKNAAAVKSGLKPDNTRWLTKGQYKSAMAGKYSPLNKYLKPVRDLDKVLRKSTAEREAEHAAHMKTLEQQHEQEKQLLRDTMIREIQEMKSDFRATLQGAAKELKVDVEQLERALQNQREAMGKAGKNTASREGRREAREILEDQGLAAKK